MPNIFNNELFHYELYMTLMLHFPMVHDDSQVECPKGEG